MTVTIKPVVFQEGAPLDPTELNKLQDNISQVYQLGIQVQNATVNQSQSVKRVAIVDAGREPVEGLVKDKVTQVDVGLNTSLFSEFLTDKDLYPFLTATVSGGPTFLDNNKDIKIAVTREAAPKILLKSNVTITSTFYVNWTAIAFKNL